MYVYSKRFTFLLSCMSPRYIHGTDIVKVLQDGELETVGRNTYGSSLQHSFTAHPKVDPVTGYFQKTDFFFKAKAVIK
jgi:hypothetical protein